MRPNKKLIRTTLGSFVRGWMLRNRRGFTSRSTIPVSRSFLAISIVTKCAIICHPSHRSHGKRKVPPLKQWRQVGASRSRTLIFLVEGPAIRGRLGVLIAFNAPPTWFRCAPLAPDFAQRISTVHWPSFREARPRLARRQRPWNSSREYLRLQLSAAHKHKVR